MPAAAPTLALRPVRPDDAAFAASLYAATRADEVASFGWDAASTAAFLAQQHAAHEAALRGAWRDEVVELDGQAVGRLVLRRDGTAVHVVDVAVHPDHQGRGTGTAVLRRVIDEARAEGRTVRLHARRANVRALALYARLGLVPVDGAGTDLDVLLEGPVDRVATWADWRSAAGQEVAVEGGGTWTVESCGDVRTAGGWRSWEVALRAPGRAGQGTVVLDVPLVGPQAVFVVPSSADDRSTTLVATFVVPDDDAPGGTADHPAGDRDGGR